MAVAGRMVVFPLEEEPRSEGLMAWMVCLVKTVSLRPRSLPGAGRWSQAMPTAMRTVLVSAAATGEQKEMK